MSELIKIYDGMTFDMSTGAVLSHGEVTYHAVEDIAHCGGGGPSTQKTTSGFAEEYKPQIKEMLGASKDAYDQGKLGQVAAQTNEFKGALDSGYNASERQEGLEQNIRNQALDTTHLKNMQARAGMTGSEQNLVEQSSDRSALDQIQGRTGMTSSEQATIAQAGRGVDLSGARAGALQQAQGALGTSQAMAGARGALGGSRQALNQASITNDLASKFAGIDQQAQQMQMQNLNQAVGAEQGQFGRLQSGQQGQSQYLQNIGAGVNAEQGQFGRLQSAVQGEAQDLQNMTTALGSQGQSAALKGQMGQATMDLAQKNADSDYTALAQRIGLFSGVAPKEQTTNKTGGK